MFALFLTLSVAEFEVSDTTIRLPFRVSGSKNKPNALVRVFKPDAKCVVGDGDLASVEYRNGVANDTICVVFIETVGNKPRSTQIDVTWQDESRTVELFVDVVAGIEIMSRNTMLAYDSINLFELRVFNSNGVAFSAMSGVAVRWWITNESVLQRIDVKDSPLETKFMYGMPDTVLLGNAIDEGSVRLRARWRELDMSHYVQLVVRRPIMFERPDYMMMRGTTQRLKLFKATVLENGMKVPEYEMRVEEHEELEVATDGENSVLSIDDRLVVTGKSVGRAFVRIWNPAIYGYNAVTTVSVMDPTVAEWPEQWIKAKDSLYDAADGPYEPNTDTIVVMYAIYILPTPENVTWILSGDWRTPGKQMVNARMEGFGFSVDGVVNVCERPHFSSNNVSVPVGSVDYDVTPIKGSGFFDIVVEDEDICVVNDGKLVAKSAGTTTIRAIDRRLKSWESVLTVHVSPSENEL